MIIVHKDFILPFCAFDREAREFLALFSALCEEVQHDPNT